MNIIENVDEKTFSLNGIKYLKNYISIVAGSKVMIFNCYENKDVLIELTDYTQFTVNGVAYASAALLQEALLNVIYSRANIAEGSAFDQNNILLYRNVGLLSGSGTATSVEVVNKIYADGLTLYIEAYSTPVIIVATKFTGDVNYRYVFIYASGKGVWGPGGKVINPSSFRLLSTTRVTPEDVKEDPNAVINNIDPVTDGDFISKANTETWDFGDSGEVQPESGIRTYYFSYTDDGVLYFALFKGIPGIYGGTETPFTIDQFVISTNSKEASVEYGFGTPQIWGYKDGNTIEDNTAAFISCFENESNILLYGEYTISATASIKANQNIFSNNAIIKRTGNANIILEANGVSDWKIGGVLTIEGNGNVSGTQRGLYIIGANNFKIDNITFKNISGDPIEFDDTEPSGRGNRGLVYNLSAQNNYGSVLFNRRAEYHTIQNVNISGSSTVGLKVLSGNVSVIGGSIVDNASGIYLGGSFGNNNSHGILSNLNFNHNDLTGGYNGTFENVQEGQTIIGCHFYSQPSGNNINIINSKGVAFTGCIIDGNITNTDATPSNKWTHLFNGCQINTGSNVTGVTQNLIFRNCFTMTGMYSGNTPDPLDIHTTGDQTITGMLTLVGAGPGTLKLQRSTYGTLFANSSTEDGYLAYNLAGTYLFYRVFGNGNISIGQAAGTDTGEKLQVNGEIKAAPGTSPTSAAVLSQLPTILKLTQNIDFPDLGSHAYADLEFDFTGAAIGDCVDVFAPIALNLPRSYYTAWVSAANKVTVRITNTDTPSLVTPAGDFKFRIIK